MNEQETDKIVQEQRLTRMQIARIIAEQQRQSKLLKTFGIIACAALVPIAIVAVVQLITLFAMAR